MNDKLSHSGRAVGQTVKTGVLAAFLNTVLIIFSFSCIFPLIWMFYSSLKSVTEFNKDIIGFPTQISVQNYINLLTNSDYRILPSIINSVRTTVISVIFVVVLGFIVGYILSRIPFRGNRLLYVLFLMGMLIPIHSLLVPIYVIFKRVGISDHWYTLILPYVAFGLSLAIFLVDGFLKSIPTALEEAAAIDGSSFTRTLFQIIFPICKPILTTVGIITTFQCWNEFSFALVLLKNPKLQTVSLALTQFSGQFSTDYPRIMAGMLLTMLPILIFYFVFSKQIIKGMVAGAVKG
ncbi:carbohydrate ABC transporter membrane protein 2 (CUT1 family) [Kineothrix alysoides]|uniref:Carbohydrate ABC transporter membrane protein 2 (CUT1 family) n=1 Tax=Kineothrix alysoides TaxID=1469948 RepID=A0A4R1QM46_9FIRM|nr:carbohydrate ABC transporter permease [Kineothrix alysoides]TCL53993.1 carbohydrate ABC transporter membrane protein 2 (CUT1 family) [Kineothrix alysoides]